MSYAGRGRSSGNDNCVALFPFLSVLICTLGTLILLLIVIARNARTQAAEDVGEQADAVAESLQNDAEMMQTLAKDLAVSKEKTSADVENERAKLASLESSIEKMVAEIKRMEDAVRELENQRGKIQFDQNQGNAELAAKKEALRKAKAELEELQKQAADGKHRSYAVIPYRGLNGTQRRPIYIECRKDCAIIQPEGIALYADDFLTAAHPDNPLDALIRAASLFYTETEAVPAGTKPYPLILVRPDGIDVYYAVRKAIQSWSEHFGYELIGADWRLQFPKANEALKERLNAQLTASRERMIPFKAALAAQARNMRAGTGNAPTADSRFLETPRGYSSNGGYGTNNTHDGTLPPTQENFSVAQGIHENNGTSVNQAATDSHFNFKPNLLTRSAPQSTRQANSPSPTYASPQPSLAKQFALGIAEVAADAALQSAWEKEYRKANQLPKDAPIPYHDSKEYHDSQMQNAQQTNSDKQQTNNNSAFQTCNPQQSASRPQPQIDPARDGVMPNVYRGATEMVRVISAECRGDAIAFKASGNRGIDREIPIPNNGTVYDVQNAITLALRDYMETWGRPGEGMYWKPEISVTLRPGAERRFEELKTLFQTAKIHVKVKNQ
ncbi:MAG: hypothetical protein LBT05_14030 [Planctomycetaceae bacterium]|jgi:hypothetical protein|nr:hypothetical protein [Planctomycetaceae bacterium]